MYILWHWLNKPQISRRIVKWLLLFLEYYFIVVYKPNITHVVANALSRLPNITKPTGLHDQTIYASLFYIDLE
jgi:hypothetical protein